MAVDKTLTAWELAELHRLADDCGNTHAVRLMNPVGGFYFISAKSYTDAMSIREEFSPSDTKPSDFKIFNLLDYWEG